MASSIKQYIDNINLVYNNRLNEDAPLVNIPNVFKLPLHNHQKGVIAKMESIERDLIYGDIKHENEQIFSNYAILGDSVGVGKSLMVLGHISRMNLIPPLTTYNTIHRLSSSNFFSLKKRKFTDLSEAGCILIVPHTLFCQWSDYIKTQTTLTNFCVAKLSQINSDDFNANIYSSEVVLISNTLLKPFIVKTVSQDIRWKRLFIDEADTIYLPGIDIKESFKTRFTWFISASWMNLIYLNCNLYLDKTLVENIIRDPQTEPHLKIHFKSARNLNAYYYMEMFRIRSFSAFKNVITYNHPLRAKVIVKCSEEYIKKSISLPPLYRQNILCRMPISHSIIGKTISPAIQQMLHAGDTEGALSQLGVKGQTQKELIEAVTLNLHKELFQLEKDYKYKEDREYSSAAAKDVALASLKTKINTVKTSIKNIEERIQGIKDSFCPICFEEPESYLITPCCSQSFCAKCLILTLNMKSECPLCRKGLVPSKCIKLLNGDISGNTIVSNESDGLLKKNDALLNILKNNPKGKFLIFSRYDNPFTALESSLDNLGVNVKHLKGNRNVIKSTLDKFQSGQIQCLLLNSQFAGAGLNITAATHVILLHAMTHEEEKQILGRAYRVGREGPLTFIKLLHENEDNYIGDEVSPLS